jgi:hypothetical protein
LTVGQELKDARSTMAARVDELGGDWPDHIATV